MTGVGSYLPKNKYSNEDLTKFIDTSDEWITKRSGIKFRHFVSKNETTSDMAVNAALNAIINAQIKKEVIDLIIVATTTPDNTFPATATLVQKKLGINAASFDVQAVCAGFIFALSVAKSMMTEGNYKNCLVIGADSMSKLLDWNDRTTSVLFGDGAGAFVLEKSNENSEWGILSSNFYSNGNFSNILHTDGGPSINSQVGKVRMNGKEVFKHAVEKLSSCLIEAINSANLKVQDIDFLVPHQANLRIIEALSKKLDIPINKIINTVDVHANTSAASIPLAFDNALENRKIKNGDIIALNAIGGGLSWGASIIKYGKPD